MQLRKGVKFPLCLAAILWQQPVLSGPMVPYHGITLLTPIRAGLYYQVTTHSACMVLHIYDISCEVLRIS